MKTVLTLLIVLALYGCDNGEIVTKLYLRENPCMCKYKYRHDVDWFPEFEDSCSKYSVGNYVNSKR